MLTFEFVSTEYAASRQLGKQATLQVKYDVFASN
jgi:hypothetical protein